VLELGVGAGHNLAFYDPAKVTRVFGVEPDPVLLGKARRRAAQAPFPVDLVGERAEALSLPEASVDTALVTFSLCTIPDVVTALTGVRRALKPTGRLFFCEHGRSPDPEVFRTQTRIEPIWKRLFGGCHLTRDIPALINASGFAIEDLDAGYAPKMGRIGGYLYRGAASPG
jgi:ubiquinone/menaquinone biosynthesis C-methylase UbiE